jgi:alpha-L-fucosidase 2
MVGEMHLLPALPKIWPDGSVSGLRARGGFEVDIVWRSGRLVNVVIRSIWGTKAKLRYRAKVQPLSIRHGKSLRFDEFLRSSEL